jgi:hypothetical protein
MLELDHIFVCVPDELDITNIPSEFGLNFSARRIHQGQGTANRCAFFNNAYFVNSPQPNYSTAGDYK